MQKAYLGDSSPDRLGLILHDIAPQKILLIRGKESYKLSGAKQYIESAVDRSCYIVYEFLDFSENPKIEGMEKGLDCLSANGADAIIAVGGGSVIDMAKLVRFFYSYKGNIRDNSYRKQKDMIPLIALPTTAGTGSEATSFAVVYIDKTKFSVSHEGIQPDFSIVNPVFSYSASRYLAACSGFDALSHAVEAYWNVHATEESDGHAMKAIRLLWENLPAAVNAKTRESMDSVSEGAYWAGRAINITKTTAPHAFSYPFTAYYNIPHGNAVALTFPFFMEYNAKMDEQSYNGFDIKKYDKKINILLSVLNIENAESACMVLREYIQSLGLLLSTDFDRETIAGNINAERLGNNPRKLMTRDVHAALDSIHKQP